MADHTSAHLYASPEPPLTGVVDDMDPGGVPANCYYYRYRKGNERVYFLDLVGCKVESRRHYAKEAFPFACSAVHLAL